MSFYLQNLEAFLKLLEEKPKLFTPSKRQELITLIKPLPDDIETLSVAIAKWYEKYDEIVDAQLEILNQFILTNNSYPSNQFSGSNVSEGANPQSTVNKEMLQKAIQPSQPAVKKTPDQS